MSLAEAAREAGRADEKTVWQHMVAHEVAQAELARRELAGQSLEAVLAPVAAQLKYPLTPAA